MVTKRTIRSLFNNPPNRGDTEFVLASDYDILKNAVIDALESGEFYGDRWETDCGQHIKQLEILVKEEK